MSHIESIATGTSVLVMADGDDVAVALALAAVIVYFLYNLSDDKYTSIAHDLEAGRWEKGVIGQA